MRSQPSRSEEGHFFLLDGFPSLGIFQVVLDPSLYWPIFDQLDSLGCPVAVFKRNVAPLPFPLQLLGYNSGCTRPEKRVNHQIAGV